MIRFQVIAHEIRNGLEFRGDFVDLFGAHGLPDPCQVEGKQLYGGNLRHVGLGGDADPSPARV